MRNYFMGRAYISPEINEWTVLNEGILCASADFDPYAGENSDNYQELF